MNLERIIEATKMVAALYIEQKVLFPKNFPTADEIALNFSDEVAFRADYFKENELITDFQYQKIRELHEKFTQMSNDKVQDYWSLEALENSKAWEECRLLAKEILKDFDMKD